MLRYFGTVNFLSTLCANFERTVPYCHPCMQLLKLKKKNMLIVDVFITQDFFFDLFIERKTKQ